VAGFGPPRVRHPFRGARIAAKRKRETTTAEDEEEEEEEEARKRAEIENKGGVSGNRWGTITSASVPAANSSACKGDRRCACRMEIGRFLIACQVIAPQVTGGNGAPAAIDRH
jgi:hypothetical protein